MLQNKSSLAISHLEWEIKQPSVSGGPPLLECLKPNSFQPTVEPKGSVNLEFVINGVDPLAVVDEQMGDMDEKIAREEMIKSIPYTGVHI